MKCTKCGSPRIPGQKFCANCGTVQTSKQPQIYDPVLTLFSIICATLYGIGAVDRLFGLMTRLFRGYFFGSNIVFSLLFSVLDMVLGAWMCLVLTCIARKRTSTNTDGLLLCLGGGALILIIERLLQVLINTPIYFRSLTTYVSMLSPTIIGVLVTVGGIYVILRFKIGEHPLAGKSADQFSSELQSTICMLKKTIQNIGTRISKTIKQSPDQK